jgi:hypothetical protein
MLFMRRKRQERKRMALGATIIQLLMELLHEAPTLIDDGKKLFHAIASDSPSGLQKVVNTADALATLADHAREAAVTATGNPDKLPAPQPLSSVASVSNQVGSDPKPAPIGEAEAIGIEAEVEDKDAEIAALRQRLAELSAS